jgi:hypothetical protein
MEKRQKRERKDLGSLIPEIKTEEKHLDDLLVGARADAERMVQEAEVEAGARVRAARAAAPRIVEAERQRRVAAVRAEAAEAARTEEKRIRAQEEAAGAAMGTAVAYVTTLVWPEERS